VVSERPARPRRGAAIGPALVVLGAAYSCLAGHFTTFSRPAEVVTFVPGVLLLAVAAGATAGTPIRPGRRRSGWAAWWVLVAALTSVELATFAAGSAHSAPTISDLVNPWIDSTASRSVGFALWLGLGWWLMRR
jgi:hypothetical protein